MSQGSQISCALFSESQDPSSSPTSGSILNSPVKCFWNTLYHQLATTSRQVIHHVTFDRAVAVLILLLLTTINPISTCRRAGLVPGLSGRPFVCLSVCLSVRSLVQHSPSNYLIKRSALGVLHDQVRPKTPKRENGYRMERLKVSVGMFSISVVVAKLCQTAPVSHCGVIVTS